MVLMVGGEGSDGGGNMEELREMMEVTWEIRWKGEGTSGKVRLGGQERMILVLAVVVIVHLSLAM